MENWRDINNYEGLYQVSDQGNVRSIKGSVKILSPTRRNGYMGVNLYKESKKKFYTVHSLVMLVFKGEREGREIDHINRDRSDNRIENLRYVTKNENLSFLRSKTSKYAGVFFDKISKIWKAEIQINKKKKRLGKFRCETVAYLAYLKEYNKIYNLINPQDQR